MTFVYRSAPYGASDDGSGPASVVRSEQQALLLEPVAPTPQPTTANADKTVAQLEACCRTKSQLPVALQIVFWLLALLLVPLVVLGIAAIVYVTQLSQGIAAARADLQRLRQQSEAERVAQRRRQRRGAFRSGAEL